ncbi:MAG: aminoacetone oxidase family FAD-binding enzyme [Planctomycetota bacterium]
MSPNRVHIAVIGAGAAGMMAAAEAARRVVPFGGRVTILEKNGKTGVKILMSGGTRCNITHDTDARGITTAFGPGRRFLQPSVGSFPPHRVIEMFHGAGVATKREETGKFFPISNRAVDVRDALHEQMIEAGAELHLRTAVQSVEPTRSAQGRDGAWRIQTERGNQLESMLADRVIVTAGGQSWPGCGTTGDAYTWLARLGHTIVTPRPALVPLVGGNTLTQSLSGLTLPDVEATARLKPDADTKPVSLSRRSSLLMTHFGFSGPAAMDVSGFMTSARNMDRAELRLDLVPNLRESKLRDELDRNGAASRRPIRSILSQWLPSRLSRGIADECPASTPAELSGKALHALIEHLKQWHVPVTSTKGFAKAEVTAGGVALSEVDPKTMASRLQRGLFIAGEVLDVDGWIGGYNFQAAFSTGRAAAIAAASTTADSDPPGPTF